MDRRDFLRATLGTVAATCLPTPPAAQAEPCLVRRLFHARPSYQLVEMDYSSSGLASILRFYDRHSRGIVGITTPGGVQWTAETSSAQ